MKHLEKIALQGIEEDLAISYSMLYHGVEKLDQLLKDLDIPEKSVINISCTGRLNQAVYLLCGLNLPYIISPLNPSYNEAELQRILAHSETAVVITDQAELFDNTDVPVMEANLSELFYHLNRTQTIDEFYVRGDLLIYTSGTTGQPKGILLTADNILANTTQAINIFGYHSDNVSASILPMFHSFTLISDLIPSMRQGAKCIVCPTFTALDAGSIIGALRDYRVTVFSAVPIIFQVMTSLFQVKDMIHLQFVISGAAPLSESVRLAYNNKFGHSIIPCYGLGEATCFATISPMNKIKPKAVGKPAGIVINIVDAADADVLLPLGEIGEITVKGNSVIEGGYFRDTQNRNCYNKQQAFLTGDLGRFDDEGYLYITGRKKNMVIRGGEKIYLEDVDSSLFELPEIAVAVSIVLMEEAKQDKAISFIVLNKGHDENRKAIVDHIRSKLSIHHTPDEIHFIQEVPRTKTGKPIINALLDLAISQ